ncbi:MAG: TonB-dependent receptor [Rhodobacteraceae bacterium]|nr:TonB-dependent receptor [Paracoccaceae bacterium]
MKSNRFMLAVVAAITAQGAQAQQSTEVDPIVINAGQDKVASDVPQSVTVVNQERLDETQAATIGDILSQVPGVSGVGSSSPLGQSFNIRGVGAGLNAAESSILTLVDGEELYYESYRQGSLFVEPELLQRVEVLRGPGSSTLYGSGAMGGVILMETKDASDFLEGDDKFSVRQKLTFESNEDKFQSTTIMSFAPDNKFDALLALSYSDIGQSEDGDGNTLIRTNAKITNFLGKANYTEGAHSFGASYQHLYSDGEDQDFNQLDGPQIGRFPGFTGWGVGDITTESQVARLEYGFAPEDNPFWDLKATLSYTNSSKLVEQGSVAAEPISATLLGERSYELWKLKVENMADLSTERFDHYLTFGVAASRKDRSADPASSSHAEAITNTYEIYAQSELTLNDRLTINTGLRIDHQKISPKSSFTAATESTSATAVEPQIAAIYRLNDNWNVFGSLSRVNRLPTDDEIYDAFSGGLPNLDLKAEKGMNYEVGVSYSGQGLFRADDAVDFKLTAFYNDIKDKIIRTGGGAGVIGFDNIDSAIIKGIEAEGRYVAGRFSASAGLSVLDGEGPDGAKLDTIANNTLTLGFGYQVLPELKLGINSVFAADRSQSRGEFDGYTVHNIYATYRPDQGALEGLEVRFGADNITDETYQPATYLSQSAKGRNFKLSLAKTF